MSDFFEEKCQVTSRP